MRLNKNFITILFKSAILLMNFGTIVLTSQLWGKEGRGEIALFLTNIALINALTNIFAGGSLSYYSNKLKFKDLVLPVIILTIILAAISSIILSIIYGWSAFINLFCLSIFIAMVNSSVVFSLGRNKINLYNLLSFLSPAFVMLFLVGFHLFYENISIQYYFYALYISNLGILISLILKFRNKIFKAKVTFTIKTIKQLLSYGLPNETSYFIQFLNYRFTYFIIIEYWGKGELGVFSTAVAISEAIWVISKSISAVQFSEILNQRNEIENRNLTKKNLKTVLIMTSAAVLCLVLVPNELIMFVFGKEFHEVKLYCLWLIPGILATALANIYGHYFSAKKELKIVIYKSLLGLISTIGLSYFLIPFIGLTGAAITSNISYIISLAYLAGIFHSRSIKEIKD